MGSSWGAVVVWEVSRGLCWLFSPLQTTGPVQTLTGYWQHLPVSGLLLAIKGMDLLLQIRSSRELW